jgi:hypothetical protein
MCSVGWHNFTVVSLKTLHQVCHLSLSYSKCEIFEWTKENQNAWEDIKNKYVQDLILINLNWELGFHVHIDASQLVIGAVLV